MSSRKALSAPEAVEIPKPIDFCNGQVIVANERQLRAYVREELYKLLPRLRIVSILPSPDAPDGDAEPTPPLA